MKFMLLLTDILLVQLYCAMPSFAQVPVNTSQLSSTHLSRNSPCEPPSTMPATAGHITRDGWPYLFSTAAPEGYRGLHVVSAYFHYFFATVQPDHLPPLVPLDHSSTIGLALLSSFTNEPGKSYLDRSDPEKSDTLYQFIMEGKSPPWNMYDWAKIQEEYPQLNKELLIMEWNCMVEMAQRGHDVGFGWGFRGGSIVDGKWVVGSGPYDSRAKYTGFGIKYESMGDTVKSDGSGYDSRSTFANYLGSGTADDEGSHNGRAKYQGSRTGDDKESKGGSNSNRAHHEGCPYADAGGMYLCYAPILLSPI